MQTRLLILSFGLILLVVGCKSKEPSSPEPSEDGTAALQGSWRTSHAEKNGEYNNDPVDGKLTLTFKGDKVDLHMMDGKEELTSTNPYKIDASKSPKEIDLTLTIRKQTHTFPGLYSVEGDELKMWLAEPGKPRPTEMKSVKGSTMLYLVFKRQKS